MQSKTASLPSAITTMFRQSAPARALLMLTFFLLSAFLFRLGLYLVYREDFQALALAQVVEAFLVGLRFDLSMTVMLIGIPILLLLLPFHWSRGRAWQWAWTWLIFIALVIFILGMAIDFSYFAYVHRHVGSEINTLQNDMGSMVEIALREYPLALLSFVAGVVLAAWGWHRLFRYQPSAPRRYWLRLASLPVLLLLMAVVGRGGVSGKPISVGEAFFSHLPAQGYLALNGAFAISRAMLDNTPMMKEFMPQAEAVALIQAHLAGKDTAFPSRDYPLHRTMPAHAASAKPNVVILMLESWGAQHIDALRQEEGLPALGITPNFDALAKQGRLYTRFYANGQRSIEGAEAILASLPTFPRMPFLGEGVEQNQQSFIGELALSQGYQTFFLQSSDRNSLRFDAIASRAGFSTYLGAEDIPNLHPTPKPARTWGTWDHNTFQAAHRLFASARQPFLGFIFTSGTHTPWITPESRFQKFSGGDRESYLNSLLYADWALGELIAAAKQAGYYDNTVFVLTADHADEFVDHAEQLPNLFHIPLLIVGPGIKPGIDRRIGSQFDILPTLINLGGWQTDYAGFGRSLLDDSRPQHRASLSINGSVLNWIEARGWVSHNLERRLGSSDNLGEAESRRMEQMLLATYQTVSQAQIQNRILPLSPAAR